jgi:hypothetical protein
LSSGLASSPVFTAMFQIFLFVCSLKTPIASMRIQLKSIF